MENKNKRKANHTEIYEELLKEAKKRFNEQDMLLIKKAYLMAKDYIEVKNGIVVSRI